jgi:hypothetical protein
MMSVVVYFGFGPDGKRSVEETPPVVSILVLGDTDGGPSGGPSGGAVGDEAGGKDWFGAVGVWAAAVACSPGIVGGSG